VKENQGRDGLNGARTYHLQSLPSC
jgi:hypothetical protein